MPDSDLLSRQCVWLRRRGVIASTRPTLSTIGERACQSSDPPAIPVESFSPARSPGPSCQAIGEARQRRSRVFRGRRVRGSRRGYRPGPSSSGSPRRQSRYGPTADGRRGYGTEQKWSWSFSALGFEERSFVAANLACQSPDGKRRCCIAVMRSLQCEVNNRHLPPGRQCPCWAGRHRLKLV